MSLQTTTKLTGSRRGVSLVEVLAVMAILIIAFAAILRLFPEGLLTINATGQRTRNQGLFKLNEEYLEKHAQNLPEAIVSVDPNTGLIRTNLNPGELHAATRKITGPPFGPVDDPRFADVNLLRRVIGEQCKIPPPTPNYGPLNESVSLYRPLFAPIYSPAPISTLALGVAAYSGSPQQRVTFQNPPTAANLADLLRMGPLGYGINYERGIVYFLPTTYPRLFKIEFSYRMGVGQPLQSVPNNCLFLPADANALPNPDALGNIKITQYDLTTVQPMPPGCVFVPLPPGAEIGPGTDFLYRRFNQLPANVAFSGDPFEFKIYDNVLGLMGFHPQLSGLPTPSPVGRGINARLDYDVDDWHILRQDVQVAAEPADTSTPNPLHAIRLGTGKIKKAGEQEETWNYTGSFANANQTYQGLQRYYPDTPTRTGTANVDLILQDAETGYLIDSTTLQRPGTPQPAGSSSLNGEIDYSAGIIFLRPAVTLTSPVGLGASPLLNVPSAGRHFRVYYRTSLDTAVATFKPYYHYLMQPNLQFLGDQQFTPDLVSGYLFFDSVDNQRTVTCDYSFINRVSGERLIETGELLQVKPPSAVGTPPIAVAQNKWWVQLSRVQDPTIFQPGSLAIIGVRGASLHTRVVWRDGKKYRQRERATILLREQDR